jgi:DNA-binding LacI/PurR family transcriptional regulator
MAATLKDVADLAGVSVKTVSNVVNGYQFVTPSTRVRVQQAIETLGYRPNLGARNLRGGRTGLIAFAVPELGIPYFAELAGLVIKAAERYGWTVLIEQTEGRADREGTIARGIRPHLVDGAIVSALTLDPAAAEAAGRSLPLVLLGERVQGAPVDHVAIDNVAAARAATEHLIGRGRHRIAAIGDQPDQSTGTAALRRTGYLAALRDAGLPDRVVPAAQYHPDEGRAAMARLLTEPRPPDAVFCFNDLLAIGALRAAHDRGLRVPEDVAVVGFDDIEEGAYATPSLTTVAPDKAAIADRAVTLIRERLDADTPSAPRSVVVPHQIRVRESTIGPAASA